MEIICTKKDSNNCYAYRALPFMKEAAFCDALKYITYDSHGSLRFALRRPSWEDKDLLIATFDGVPAPIIKLYYGSNVSAWTPSGDEMFAEDWEVWTVENFSEDRSCY